MSLFSKGIFHRLGNPSWQCFVCSSPVLFPRPPGMLYPEGMWLPQQLPDGESVLEVAVDSIHCLGIPAKAFYWNEELSQSQERQVKLWKLPQQVRHWMRSVATLFPGRGCALCFVLCLGDSFFQEGSWSMWVSVGSNLRCPQCKQPPWLWPAHCAEGLEILLLAKSVWRLPKLNRRGIHHFIVIDLLIWSSSEFYWLDNSKLKSSYWMEAME